MLCDADLKAKKMPRLIVRMGVLALSALAAAAAAGAAPAATEPQQQTLAQGVDSGIRDAQLKRSQGDYAGAVHLLSQLMLVAPDDARVVGEYGKVLIQQGRARDSLDFLTRAVQLRDGDWTLYSALGVAYDQLGDYQNARAAYERALSLKPNETAILNNYAMSRMLAGDFAQAKKLITQAAAGSNDERIAHNVKLIDGLAPAAVANAAPPPAVHPAPAPAAVKPLPPPKAIAAQGAPRALVKPAATTMTQSTPLVPRTGTVKPAATVMMQSVPYDSKAGRVKPPATHLAAHHAPAAPKVAAVKPVKPAVIKAAKVTKPKVPAASGIPALRLANDRP
jgi:Flp pilus assembly protein TadD